MNKQLSIKQRCKEGDPGLLKELIVQGVKKDLLKVSTNFTYWMERLRKHASPKEFSDIQGEWYHMRRMGLDSFSKWKRWSCFFFESHHLIVRADDSWPAHKIFLQLAVEHADNSPVTLAAEKWLKKGNCDWLWLRNRQRPNHVRNNGSTLLCDFSREGLLGVLVGRNRNILVWLGNHTLQLITREGRVLRRMEGHQDEIRGAIQRQDGTYLSWSKDGFLFAWSESGERFLQKHTFDKGIASVVPCHNGSLLTWSFDGPLKLVAKDLDEDFVLYAQNQTCPGAIQKQDGTLLTWSDDKTIIHRSEEGKPLRVMRGHQSEYIRVLELSDGRILSWSEEGKLFLWSAQGYLLKVVDEVNFEFFEVRELSNRNLLSWELDSRITLWSPELEKVKSLETDFYCVVGILELPNQTLAVWFFDGTIALYDFHLRFLHKLNGHTDDVNDVTLLQNGSLMSWSSDGSILVQTLDGKNYQYYSGHTPHFPLGVEGVLPLDSQSFLSWGSDQTLRVWDHCDEVQEQLEPRRPALIGIFKMNQVLGRWVWYQPDKETKEANLAYVRVGNHVRKIRWFSLHPLYDRNFGGSFLFAQGRMTVGNKNGQVCFLQLMDGNKEITLDHAEKEMLAEEGK